MDSFALGAMVQLSVRWKEVLGAVVFFLLVFFGLARYAGPGKISCSSKFLIVHF